MSRTTARPRINGDKDMSKNRVPAPAPPDVRVNRDELLKPPGSPLKPVAGSDDPRFNNVLLNAVVQTLWVPSGLTEEGRVPGRGVTGGGAPRLPAWAGQVSWRLPGG
jgi:hypothetical protein